MAPHAPRTAVVLLLAAVVGVRIAASEPLWDTATAVSRDPGSALASALDGWTTQGTLGSPTADGIRTVPLSAVYLLGQAVGLSSHLVQVGLRSLVLVLAVAGALRLVRRAAPVGPSQAEDGSPSWIPWLAAALFGCGAVLVAAVAHRPMDGLAAALGPWVLAPLIGRSWGWGGAARSALWLGPVGFADPMWALAVLLVGVAAAAPRRRAEIAQGLRWLLLAGMSSAWWLGAAAWEHAHAVDLSELLGPAGLVEELAAALGWPALPMPVVVAAVLAPLIVAAAALALRSPGLDRPLVVVLAAGSVVGMLALGSGAVQPARFGMAGAPPAPLLGPPAWWGALAGLLALHPLVAQLRARWHDPAPDGHRPAVGTRVVVGGLGLLVVATSATGAVLAARERSEPDTWASLDLWQDVAAWSADAPAGRVLVLPPSPDLADRAVVSWALSDRAWVDRSSLPASGASATSALDTAIGRMRRGQGGPGTVGVLDRLGIAFVVLRDDLPGTSADGQGNALVRRALVAEGASRVAVFDGPAGLGAPALRNFGVLPAAPTVEIWARAEPTEALHHPGPPLLVAGDGAAVPDLVDAGVAGDRPVVVVPPSTQPQAAVRSDGARRRDLDQRVPIDGVGPALTADQSPTAVPQDPAPTQTSFRRLAGARAVTASSSSADLDSTDRRVAAHPLAAVDANPFTGWASAAGSGVDEWWQVEFARPVDLADAVVTFNNDVFSGHTVTGVRAETDQQSVDLAVTPGEPLRLQLPGRASRLRLVVTEVSKPTSPTDRVSILEVTVPGLTVHDQLQVPGDARAWVLSSLPGSSATCVPAPLPWPSAVRELEACDGGLSVQGFEGGDLRRRIESPGLAGVAALAWVRPLPSGSTRDLVDELGRPSVRAEASSVAASDLRTRPQAAVDADPDTAWRPDPTDPRPTLTLTWSAPAALSQARLVLSDPTVTSTPTTVRVSTPDGPVATIAVPPDGRISWPTTLTRALTLEFLTTDELPSQDVRTGGTRPAPIGIAEVELDGVEVRFAGEAVWDLQCGFGPPMTIAGRTVSTAMRASANQVRDGAVLRATPCSSQAMPRGEVIVEVPRTLRWTPLGLVLADASSPVGSAVPGLEDTPPQPEPLRVDLSTAETIAAAELGQVTASGAGTLGLSVPAGSGWSLRGADGAFPETALDGWAQGWVLGTGSAQLAWTYSAGWTLKVAVLLGWAAWALVAGVAWAAGRSPSRVAAPTRRST